MTIGGAITIAELACGAAIASIAIAMRNRPVLIGATAFLAALIISRVAAPFVPDGAKLLFIAATYFAAGGYCIRVGIALDNSPLVGCGGVIIASRLCYVFADAIGAQPAFLSPIFLIADTLSFAALGVLLWGSGIGRGKHDLGSDRAEHMALMGAGDYRGRVLAQGGVCLPAEKGA